MKNLESFENRSQDWLAAQRKHEEQVSVWDFDEAKKIKQEHAQRHASYNEHVKVENVEIQRARQSARRPSNPLAKFVSTFILIVWLIIFLTIIMNVLVRVF